MSSRALGHHAPEQRQIARYRVDMAGPVLVGDATLHDIPVVGPDASLVEVLHLFDARSQRMAVVDVEGRMVGLISD
jgi:CBS domain-containing protein